MVTASPTRAGFEVVHPGSTNSARAVTCPTSCTCALTRLDKSAADAAAGSAGMSKPAPVKAMIAAAAIVRY